MTCRVLLPSLLAIWVGAACSGSTSSEGAAGQAGSAGAGGFVMDAGKDVALSDGSAGQKQDAAETGTQPDAPEEAEPAEAGPDAACIEKWQECANATCCAPLKCMNLGITQRCVEDYLDGGKPEGGSGCLNAFSECSAPGSTCCEGTSCQDSPVGKYCLYNLPEAGTSDAGCVAQFQDCSAPGALCCPGTTCVEALGYKRCAPELGDGGGGWLDGWP